MENTTKPINPFILPDLVATWSLSRRDTKVEDHQFFDVKFYPYPIDDDPIFAIVGFRDILICGTRIHEDGLANERLILRDEEPLGRDKLPILNTCSWAYINQATPLLAVSGPSGQIKLLDGCSGRLFSTLTGHGVGLVNDLAAHPQCPWILASASMDESIRIWDLRRWDDKHESPCIIICGQGQGHQGGVLSIAWHESGRYIVSGGHDNAVCLWTIPDLSEGSEFWNSISPAQRKSKSQAIHVVHYPHFATSAVHSDYVDCVRFYGDMILSKSAADLSSDNKIVLWEITGFETSLKDPPSTDSAVKSEGHKETRSGFYNQPGGLDEDNDESAEAEDKPALLRHLEFRLPEAPYFYTRFELLTPSREHPDLHPVLVCGNTQGQILMWDLKLLELGHNNGLQTPPAENSAHKKAPILNEEDVSVLKRYPLGSQASSTPGTGKFLAPHPQTVPIREAQYSISDPFRPIKAHHIITLPEPKDARTDFRGVSWSPCGTFCVVVGFSKTMAQAALLSRWV